MTRLGFTSQDATLLNLKTGVIDVMSLRKSRREFLVQIPSSIGLLVLSILLPLERVLAASKGSKGAPSANHKKHTSAGSKASVMPQAPGVTTNKKDSSPSADPGDLASVDPKPASGAVIEPSPSPEADSRQVIDPKSPAAVELVYVEKHADVLDEDLRRSRQGVAFENQICLNCLFYKPDGVIADAEVGRCNFFGKSLAKGHSWCKSWAKKV